VPEDDDMAAMALDQWFRLRCCALAP
jgi:hypothetical protein